jgi:hypothetical protein
MKTKKEWKFITDIKNKIILKKLTVTNGDSGKTLVILKQDEYNINYKTLCRITNLQ